MNREEYYDKWLRNKPHLNKELSKMDKKEYYDKWLRSQISCMDECLQYDLCKKLSEFISLEFVKYVPHSFQAVDYTLCTIMKRMLECYDKEENINGRKSG